MHRKIAAIATLLAMAFAHNVGQAATPGFQTGSCEYPAGEPLPGSGNVLDVPATYTTVQAAVDAADEGDTIRIAPGTYKEAVVVKTPGLRIQGVDRNTVIFDGESTKQYAIYVLADRVLVENMTGHNYTETAFYWGKSHPNYAEEYGEVAGVTGYWGRYLTAYNNGQYGVYAFDARCGQFDHSYASGNADSGFYIGECFPCDAVITNVVAERNAIGYSGTNAGGNLSLRDSIWRDNALGLVPNSLNGEDRPPQRGVMIENNLIDANNNKTAPGSGIAACCYGVGIAIAGGNGNQVMGNKVIGHEKGGIILNPLPDPNPDHLDQSPVWIPSGNTIWGNTVYSSAGDFDLAQGVTSGPNNCWSDNVDQNGVAIDPLRSAPIAIETIYDCGLPITPPGGDPRVEEGLIEGLAGVNGRAPSPWSTYAAPALDKPSMPSNDLVMPLEKWLPALGLMSW